MPPLKGLDTDYLNLETLCLIRQLVMFFALILNMPLYLRMLTAKMNGWLEVHVGGHLTMRFQLNCNDVSLNIMLKSSLKLEL